MMILVTPISILVTVARLPRSAIIMVVFLLGVQGGSPVFLCISLELQREKNTIISSPSILLLIEFRSKNEITLNSIFSQIREYFLLKIQNNSENIENMDKTWFS